MSTFHVTSVNPEPRPWQSAYGEMHTYVIKGSLDGAPEEQVQINTKADKAKVPYAGEVIDCFISKTDPVHGKTIKRTQTPPGQAAPVQPILQVHDVSRYVPRAEEPDRQDSIIRQSSFERAILIQAKKADILIAEKKFAEAHTAMEFKTITALADVIGKYAKGKIINPPQVDESDMQGFDDGPGYNEEVE